MNPLLAGTCLAACLLVASCVSGSRQPAGDTSEVSAGEHPADRRTATGTAGSAAGFSSTERIAPVYAEGFRLDYAPGYIRLDINDPQNEEAASYHYALIPRGVTPPALPEGYTPIEIPIRSVICMTSLQLSNFIKLDALDKVVGITSTRHLFNPEMNRRLEQGETARIGIEGNFDTEVIMSVNPDLILISPFKRGGYEALKDVGIPLIPHLGYKETTPLGQAEWIKFVGLLLGDEATANQKFAAIEKRYNHLKALTAEGKVKKRPVVFSGEMRGGNWYAVGGKSFLAQLFKDAGADYFLKEDTRSGGVTLDFETVYNRADEADYWRIVNSYPGRFTYQALLEQDARYGDFRAFREKAILYCNMKQTPFYESMPTEPEVVLADMVAIFHPDLLPGHTPVYYTRLHDE